MALDPRYFTHWFTRKDLPDSKFKVAIDSTRIDNLRLLEERLPGMNGYGVQGSYTTRTVEEWVLQMPVVFLKEKKMPPNFIGKETSYGFKQKRQ